jgi:hypothetical protein
VPSDTVISGEFWERGNISADKTNGTSDIKKAIIELIKLAAIAIPL